jgi:hypothetical protein
MPGQVVWVLGDLWMASYMTVFDAGNMRIGFACDKDTTCKGGKRHLKGDAYMGPTAFDHVLLIGFSFAFAAVCFYYKWMIEEDIWYAFVGDDNEEGVFTMCVVEDGRSGGCSSGGGDSGGESSSSGGSSGGTYQTIQSTPRKQTLVQFYEKHNPEKVGEVDMLLANHSVGSIATSLYEKYNEVPEGWEADVRGASACTIS